MLFAAASACRRHARAAAMMRDAVDARQPRRYAMPDMFAPLMPQTRTNHDAFLLLTLTPAMGTNPQP